VRPLGAGAQAMHPASSVDLSEMFGELKQELEEEVVAGDDDPESIITWVLPSAKWACWTRPLPNFRSLQRDRTGQGVWAAGADLHLAGAVLSG